MTGRMANNPPRTFKGFAALERTGGPVIWGTLRPSEAETRAIFAKWNPLQTPVIVPIRLSFGEPNLTGSSETR